MIGSLEFRKNTSLGDSAALAVWERPSTEARYVIGADVAEGLEHGDYSCAQVISVQTGNQVAMWHGHIPADEFADELSKLGRWYNRALVGVEANNHGLTTLTALRNLRYPAIYRRRSVDQVTNKATSKMGWLTTKTSKPLMIDELAMALKAEELVINDKRTLTELRTYVRDDKGHMHGSPHDDTVMALGVANQMRKFVFVPEYQPQQDDYWSMQWWIREADQASSPKGQWDIGETATRRR